MQKINITKDSINFSFWDETSETWIDRSVTDSDLPITWFISHQTYVEKGTTLRQILNTLKTFAPEINFIFVNYLKGMLLEDMIKLFDEATLDKTSAEKIDAICLIWSGQMKRDDDEAEYYINIQPSLMALEIDETLEENDQFHEIYEISISQLLDKPLVMDDFIEFYDEDDSDEVVLTGSTNWTMFDFIRAVLNDLTMYTYVTKLFPSDSSTMKQAPLTPTDLFDHMENLDKFFKRGQNDI